MVCVVFLVPLLYNPIGQCQSLKDEETRDGVYGIKEVLVAVYLHTWIREAVLMVLYFRAV